mmetsp:Transcript_704/g.2343  ORF Transcript_704/g.2343 Transcript_704/m.2343 type:complete len:146 (-) Transcript_704:366-803(-)
MKIRVVGTPPPPPPLPPDPELAGSCMPPPITCGGSLQTTGQRQGEVGQPWTWDGAGWQRAQRVAPGGGGRMEASTRRLEPSGGGEVCAYLGDGEFRLDSPPVDLVSHGYDSLCFLNGCKGWRHCKRSLASAVASPRAQAEGSIHS